MVSLLRSPGGNMPVRATLVISLAFFLTLSLSANAQRIEWMKQVTADTGWVATNRDLFWTTSNGGEWKNITPPQLADGQEISAVFFLDTSRGWLVVSRGDG